MIELTVKTLDSQNHAFSVDDDITVAQFKEKIAETVNIPADTQRIIYCGRVLQDNSKLNEYDVNGKVVHLVQRPPPSANQRPNQRSESPPPHIHQPRRIRGLEYLGSMRFPANAFDQNLMPPLPTHSLAASRLNVARRMLRRADAVLSALENPTARPPDQPTQEEHQEEVTPVFEARVIVPDQPIDEAVVLSAVQSSLLNATNPATNLNSGQVSSEGTSLDVPDSILQNSADGETPHSISSTPEVISPLTTSSENLTTVGEEHGAAGSAPEEGETANNAGNEANTSNSSTSENISRTTEYADLLDTLNRFHIRLAPFLEQYNNFMREDPTVSQENARPTQAMINRVSEILHFLGHAYHSLSDIIVRVRTPPPRPLLCRPILIQHSAIVQAGIPIQVEAQINFSADRSNTSANGTATSQPSSTETTTATQQATTTTASNNTGPTITAHMQPAVVGFPLIPGTGVRVETFHLPQTANISLDRGNLNRNNNNNNRGGPYVSVRSTADLLAQAAASAAAAAAAAASASVTPSSTDTNVPVANSATSGESAESVSRSNLADVIAAGVVDSIAAAATANRTSGAAQTANGNNAQVTINNPNVEFFMEVTPESITIDSLETSFVGANQANDILQGSLNPPPPELIQSIMQMAGQLINRGAQNSSNTSNAGTTTTTTAAAAPTSSVAATEASPSDSQATSTSNGGAARTTPFQNSQARGNTQTQPTTATHTRSTARPHVHLAQHAMQGFDPFLPCNSHHVTPRRRFPQPSNVSQLNNQQNQTNSTTTRSTADGSSEPRTLDQNNPFYNIMRSIINSVRSVYTNQQGSTQATPQSTTSSSTSSTSSNTLNFPLSPTAPPPTWMSNLQNMNLSDSSFHRAPTIAQLLQQLPDDSYTEGESIFTDLIMLLSRNLTIGDVIQVNSGRLEPLMRIRSQLRNFFLYRILDGSQSTAAVDRGVDRLLTEIQPFLDHLALLDTRDDIDIVRSVQTLLRARLPNIISLVASRSPNSLKMVVDQVRTTGRQFCALAVRASRNGRQGVENVFDLILSRYMQGIPRDLQQWTLMTSRAQMGMILSNLDVPESILQPYIVREIDAITPTIADEQAINSNTSESEPMQVEEEPLIGAGGSAADEHAIPPVPPLNIADDPEPLPSLVLGSESWHGQVPVDWVPIITRDSQRQRRQNSQPPLSDAYLSGMPSKRRKIVTNSKPQGSLPQVITESVRRAVTATGLSNVAPLETVAQAAGADINIQSAYRDLLRSSVQSGLRDNEDFTPERFPNASNYFNKHPQ